MAEGALRTARAGSVGAQGRRVSELARREQARGGRGRLLAEAADRREVTFEETKRFRRVDGCFFEGESTALQPCWVDDTQRDRVPSTTRQPACGREGEAGPRPSRVPPLSPWAGAWARANRRVDGRSTYTDR